MTVSGLTPREWRECVGAWLARGVWVAAAPLAPQPLLGHGPKPGAGVPGRAQPRRRHERRRGPVWRVPCFKARGRITRAEPGSRDSSGAVRGPRRRTGRPDIAGPIRVTQQTCIAASLSDVHRRSSGPARVHRVLGRPGASSCRRARL